MSTVRSLRAALVVAIGLLHLLLGVLWVRLAALRSLHAGRRAAGRWCRVLLALTAVRSTVRGRPRTGVLVVANHLSWLDIVALMALHPMTFLSKVEVRHWPLVGRLTAALGTLFIGRGSAGAAERASAEMAARLVSGESVLFFPEGRISLDQTIQPFRPRLLRAAYDAGRPLQPVAITYRPRHCATGGDDLGALVPERDLLRSAWWLAGHGVEIEITFLEPIRFDGYSRRALAEEARRQIAAASGLPAVGRTPPEQGDR